MLACSYLSHAGTGNLAWEFDEVSSFAAAEVSWPSLPHWGNHMRRYFIRTASKARAQTDSFDSSNQVPGARAACSFCWLCTEILSGVCDEFPRVLLAAYGHWRGSEGDESWVMFGAPSVQCLHSVRKFIASSLHCHCENRVLWCSTIFSSAVLHSDTPFGIKLTLMTLITDIHT